jgi:hypothetical protein
MKPKYFLFLCLSFLIFNSSLLIGTIRYVSKTGTSTPPYTSWQTAADSIQKCINICVDGDTVYVANGIYKENLVINTVISLMGSSMDSTIIDGTGLLDNTLTAYKNFKISNFNILGRGIGFSNSVTIFAYGETTEINDCYIHQTGSGIFIRSSCLINNVFINRISVSGIVNFGSSTNVLNTIQNCSMFFELDNSEAINVGVGIYNIHNNIIIFNSGINQNPRNGITISIPKSVHIYNNLISEFGTDIFVEAPSDTVYIKNNILINRNDTGILTSGGGWVVTHNSIFNKNKIGIRGNWKVFSDYNLFWENLINLQGVAMGDSDIVADPMFVNDTIPTANGSYDFHLQKYSPAIDKGDPSILDVDGSRSDIGMFGGPYGESYTYQDLAPKPPGNLSAVMDSGLVHLKWNKNTEADLFRYRVYRDTVPDFISDTTKIIAVLSDTVFYDDPPQKFISGNYYYKITAIDSAYNQSPASEEAHINITGIPEAPPIVVEHYNLLQNYPNPFNPSTTIPYRLKSPGYVKVMVYNLLGEQVKVLVNKYQSAGYYEVLFHPTTTERQSAEGKIEFETGYGDIVSGIYLYRIEVIGEGNIPVFTDMNKMMLVK